MKNNANIVSLSKVGDDGLRALLNDADYLTLIKKHFPKLPDKETAFFVNERRFDIFNQLVGSKLGTNIKSILNVASGPFAFENYVVNSQLTQIDAIDINCNIETLFEELRSTSLFNHVNYETQSVESFSTKKKYDLVLINDLFYHKGVDFFEIFSRLVECVKPHGFIYFDLLDVRARKIWSAFGKDDRFVRYDLDLVKEKVEKSAFEIISIKPSLGIGGKVDHALRSTLFSTFKIANNHIFFAQRKN